MSCRLTKPEVPLAGLGDSTVGHSSSETIPVAVGCGLRCGAETSVSSLGHYDDSDPWTFLAYRIICLLAGLSEKR